MNVRNQFSWLEERGHLSLKSEEQKIHSLVDETQFYHALTNDFNADRSLNAFSQYEQAENAEQKLRMCRILGEPFQSETFAYALMLEYPNSIKVLIIGGGDGGAAVVDCGTSMETTRPKFSWQVVDFMDYQHHTIQAFQNLHHGQTLKQRYQKENPTLE